MGDGATLRLHGQSVERRDRPRRQWNDRHADLGRRARRCRAALVGVLASRKRADASGHSDRDLSRAAHGGFRFRRGRCHRPLSEGARHHASLCVALHEGAQGQHPWLRHRRPHQDQSGTRRRCRLRAIERRAAAARPRSDSRFRSQPCRRAFRRQSLVARRAGMGSGLAACGIVRHRLGTCCRTAPAAACCCRSSARPMAKRWKRARSSFATTPSEGSFSAWYFEHRLPIAPERYSEILRNVVKEAGAEDSAAGKRILELASRYKGLRHPNRKEAPAFKAELKGIAGGADMIARGLAAYRAGPDRAAQTLALHHLLERQHYRLGHWRLASSDINYRRFFDINTLAGLRVEDAGTFDAIHRLVKKLIAEGRLAGPAARSHRRPARSRAIFSAPAPPDPGSAGKGHRAVLHGDRENPRRARRPASLHRRSRHHRLRMAQCHHAGTGRRQGPRAARRGVAADQQHAAEAGASPEGRQTPGSRDPADQRIHGADAAARAHRRRTLLHPRLFRRQPAAGARTLCPAFSGLSHLSDLGRRLRRTTAR